MIQFLQQVARHYHSQGGMEKLCFIFPNRRSMAFFTKYLSDAVRGSDSPVIAPQMFTVNDFFYKVSEVDPTDRVCQLLDLYKSYIKVFAQHNTRPEVKPETLDEFIFWGDIILGDFNDVDKYLVEPKQLFANVADFMKVFIYLFVIKHKFSVLAWPLNTHSLQLGAC